jgi:hypothetical protein
MSARYERGEHGAYHRQALSVSDQFIDAGAAFSYKDEDGPGWFVALEVKNVLHGDVYSTIRAPAVVDDFGSLVITGPLQ